MKSYPPPRESRLRKAALTLLVAASAAVFVCAPAGAAVPGQRPLIDPPPIFRITSIGPYLSGYDTFEGVIQGMYVKTNVNFDTVDWYVNDSFVRTSDGPSTTSVFSHAYADLGSTTGAPVVVKAVAADANGDTATDQATINVWTKSETVNIVSKTSDQTLVGATTENVSVQTDVGFYRVDWSVDDGSGGSATATTTNGPGLTSQIAYDFSTVPHGNTVTFTATPYGVNADGEAVAGEAASIEIVAWKMISIEYCSPSPFSAKVVKGEELFVYAYTNIPFSRVEYSVEHGDTYPDPSDGANDTESQFSHTFNNLRHDDDDPTFIEAHERDIVVTAYATINGEEVKSDPFIVEATVYNNNDFIWKSIKASVDSVTHVTDTQHDHILTTSHSVVYYNDDADLPQVDFLRQSGWWVGNEPGAANMLLARGPDIEDLISLELAYSATFSASLTTSVKCLGISTTAGMRSRGSET